MKAVMPKTFIVTILFLLFIVSGCNKNDNKETSDDLKKKELELKEKELQLKEKEMMEKKEAELKEKEKQIDQKSQTKERNNFDLSGSYWGSIKDGTRWYVYISSFDGKNLKGYNRVYWKTTPDGFKTNFTGTFDSQSNQIIINEDRNAKGSGKFIGTVSQNGNTMHGDWYRYTDNGSFTWNLERSDEEDQ
jgi:hypothetical protein